MSCIIFAVLVVLSQLQLALSDAEIEALSEQLFRESEPNLFPYVKVNLQSSTTSWSRSDDADSPLLSIDESTIYNVPTIKKLRALFDNYELNASDRENVTSGELQENEEFINAVLDTQVMKTAMKFLNRKGLVQADRTSQFDLLKKIWFDMYARTGGNVGSSGFEHVFLNEMKYGSPMGGHNWIYYYYKENRTGTQHDVDYKGYMDNLMLGNKGQIVKFRMSFKGETKPVNSMFLATPPELDMAIYTVCFEMDQTYCSVSMDGKKFTIRAFPFYYNGKRMIGATYPVI